MLVSLVLPFFLQCLYMITSLILLIFLCCNVWSMCCFLVDCRRRGLYSVCNVLLGGLHIRKFSLGFVVVCHFSRLFLCFCSMHV